MSIKPGTVNAPDLAKPFRVVITKADGVREVGFAKYSTLAECELAVKALRRHGIDARAVSDAGNVETVAKAAP